MADAQKHTEAWQDLPWKKFQKVVFRLQKRIYQAACSWYPCQGPPKARSRVKGQLSCTVLERQEAG